MVESCPVENVTSQNSEVVFSLQLNRYCDVSWVFVFFVCMLIHPCYWQHICSHHKTAANFVQEELFSQKNILIS